MASAEGVDVADYAIGVVVPARRGTRRKSEAGLAGHAPFTVSRARAVAWHSQR